MSETVERGPVLYARLRSGSTWSAAARLDGLDVDRYGDVVLARVPSVTPSTVTDPSLTGTSGIALGSDCRLFLGDLSSGRVVSVRRDCGEVPQGLPERTVDVARPAAFCVGPHSWLFVADGGAGQILVFTPDLELRGRWPIGESRPIAIAFDGEGIVVLDAAGALLRFAPTGAPDNTFSAGLMLPPECGGLRALAADPAGLIYVGCSGTGGVLVLTRSGARVDSLSAVGATALAIAGDVLYAADAPSGEINRFSLASGTPLGSVVGFRGPVAGLAADADGSLYIKTDHATGFVVAREAGAHGRAGVLEVAALDAGRAASWRRALARAVVPDGSSVRVETFQHNDRSAPPVWRQAVATDVPLGIGRYLWLRVLLESRDPLVTPRLQQVHAETPGESYAEHLPAVYTRDAKRAEFLETFLELARSLLGDLETDITELPRLVAPTTAPADQLAWLASWQGFEVPARIGNAQHAEELRALLARMSGLNSRRGTLAGLTELVEIETGVRAHVVEAYRARSVWVLGSASALGFDTGMPRVSLGTAVVGHSALDSSALGPEESLGTGLFEDTAHRFSVLVYAADASTEEAQRGVRAAVDELKPAHTEAHVCFIAPNLRVGMQSRIGIDSIVAGEPAPTTLGEGRALDRGARLASDPVGAAGAVERRARIGVDTRLG
jgi:phage tail-like protein